MKKLNLLMLIALVSILFSCREELQYTENFTPPKPHQDGIAKNINFSGFYRETGVPLSEASLSIKKAQTNKNGKSSLQNFDIDTTFIKKFTYQKTKSSYSLRAFKRGEDPSKGIYNLVYYYDGSVWKNDIYKLTYSSEFLQRYNSNTLIPFAGTIEHIGEEDIKNSPQSKSGDVYTCSWSTGQFCYCADHTPTQCSGCPSGFRTVTTFSCSPADGGSTGGGSTTVPPPSLGSPPFNDNPGGGNGSPIGDYEFYNNLPVFDDPQYLEYTWKYNLWYKLSNRLSFDPELYFKFEDFQVRTKGKRLADLEYLAAFAEQKNKFTHWAINFLTQNLDVSWDQFQNWFLTNIPNDFLEQVILENPATILNYESLSSPNFKMRRIDQIKYPKFTTIIKNLKEEIQNNPATLNRLVQLTGLTESQIIGSLTFGQGPTIKLVPNLTGPSGPNYGNFNPANPTFININLDFVLGLEQASLSSTRHATAFLLAVTVLHEFIHFGNYISGYDTNGNEMGNLFEISTYGIIITHLNAGYYIIQLK
ncbi:hypothetical protein J2810_000621 [Chryseobacterium rhizosphaerae]|uniref:hypothetical protein n=1 Tax=Chryseobacterium rhizosphaerae TaxID=395937 RepID=UPI00285E69AA|nr:hypothetical protein [Chryseobacterium rhizosphaerae]MDR6544581.1 hypothetical protein [Chryseobacterium rhizosphaerae]